MVELLLPKQTARVRFPSAPPSEAPRSALTPSPEPTEPETCANSSEVVSYTDNWHVERERPLRDLGSRDFAAGEVTLDDEGNVETYTVAPGDVESVIAERLCAYPNLASLNHVRQLEPNQVLWLTPDPETPWLDYFSPFDAPAGFDQIGYQRAMDSARIAVDAGDVAAVRAVWSNELAGMHTNPEQIAEVQGVLDTGDLDAIRQMFS